MAQMTMKLLRYCGLLLLLGLSGLATALEVPPLAGRVTDLAELLDAQTRNRIDARLQALEQATGAQVAVLTLPSLGGESLETFSVRVARAWKLGREGADDGVLLLVARDDRDVRIEVGYGLEAVLTDAASHLVIQRMMLPEFRQGHYDRGIEQAVEAIDGQLRGQTDALPAAHAGKAATGGAGLLVGFFALLLTPIAYLAVSLKGANGWLIYGIAAPFVYFVGLAVGQLEALGALVGWLLLGAALRLLWPKRWRIESDKDGGSHASIRSPRGSSRRSSGSGFSGSGGGFGGGGSSGRW